DPSAAIRRSNDHTPARATAYVAGAPATRVHLFVESPALVWILAPSVRINWSQSPIRGDPGRSVPPPRLRRTWASRRPSRRGRHPPRSRDALRHRPPSDQEGRALEAARSPARLRPLVRPGGRGRPLRLALGPAPAGALRRPGPPGVPRPRPGPGAGRRGG